MNKIKKLLAGLVSLSMVFVMASCGETEETSTADKKTEETTVSETTVAEETEAPEETEETEEETEEEVEEDEQSDIDTSKLKYDFTGLDSEEAANILSSGKYTITLVEETMGITQTMYCDNDKCRVDSAMFGMEYGVLILDGGKELYMLIDGAHTSTTAAEAGLVSETGYDMFAELGYYESGETEYNGATCKYDQYYEANSEALFSFIMDDSNKVIAIEQDGQPMKVDNLSADFDASLLEIPVDSELVDMEEFSTRMSAMAASGLGGLVEGEETAEEGAETEAVEEEAETEAATEEETAE